MTTIGAYTVTTSGWQPGTGAITQDWQQGTGSTFSTSSGATTNRAPNVTDPIANVTFVAIKRPAYMDDKPWEMHHQHFMFRLLDDVQNESDSFRTFKKQLIRHCAPRISRGKEGKTLYTQRDVGDLLGPCAFCVMVTVPELNYELAKAQVEDGVNFSPVDLWKLIRPLGVCITPPDTMNHTDNGAFGTMRVLTVEGPCEMRNMFGHEAEEGATVWVRMVAKDVQEDTMYYQLSDKNLPKTVNKDKNKASPLKIWQFEFWTGPGEPPVDNIIKVGGLLEHGINMRIGKIQHIYLANRTDLGDITLGAGRQNHSNVYSKHGGNVNYDLRYASIVPAIRVFIDCSVNLPFMG
jgi:hypothetical protein